MNNDINEIEFIPHKPSIEPCLARKKDGSKWRGWEEETLCAILTFIILLLTGFIFTNI